MITTRNTIPSIGDLILFRSAFEYYVMWVAFLVSGCLAKVLFFNRISIFVYSCFIQNWLCEIDMWDFQAVQSLRSSVSLSSIAVTNRRTIPMIMWVALVILSLFALAIWKWNMWLDECNGNIGPMYFCPFSLQWLLWPCSLTGLELIFLAVEKLFTVSDKFWIYPELDTFSLKNVLYDIRWVFVSTTDSPLYNWDWVVWLVQDNLNVLITVYYLHKVSKPSRKSRSELYTIDVNVVFKNEDFFKELEEQLKKEFSIEYLNLLVSCIFFRLTVICQGNFRIESSGLESNSENYNMLNWRETIGDEHEDPKERARFSYSEFCAQGVLQQISLKEQILKNLSTWVKNLSYIYNHLYQDLFREAFNLVYYRLDKNLVPRLKARLYLCRRNKLRSCSINDRNHETSLLAGVVEKMFLIRRDVGLLIVEQLMNLDYKNYFSINRRFYSLFKRILPRAKLRSIRGEFNPASLVVEVICCHKSQYDSLFLLTDSTYSF